MMFAYNETLMLISKINKTLVLISLQFLVRKRIPVFAFLKCISLLCFIALHIGDAKVHRSSSYRIATARHQRASNDDDGLVSEEILNV